MSQKLLAIIGAIACLTSTLIAAADAQSEKNPVAQHTISLGPEGRRLIVGFRVTSDNVWVQEVQRQSRPREGLGSVQARTDSRDLMGLVQRVQLNMAKSRQVTPSVHVVYLQTTLYGAELDATLAALRADPAVRFADVDQRRFPHSIPDDPLFAPTANATGQWYLLTPNATDASATDAVSAWAVTTGSSSTVIADVDSGIRFEHPDLLRAGFGGRLLPGYDFVGEDLNRTSGAPLGTFLTANDDDGWDPDPSDPGDWIDSADQKNPLFPSGSCAVSDSSWHGTRVMGLLGALTNNALGIAGMAWNPYLLPVRALGKCGGYDSDIIAGMQWAAGLSVTGVPDNPFPADIINLSLGGSGACTSAYADTVSTLTAMGVLIVASAGNQSGPVDAPANCTDVLGVAGLRNAGTKVGYSSFGAEVGVAAPAGNCVNSSGPCLRSIDTTSNSGLTTPAASTYTDQLSPNLGTSFSAPIVSGIAALMRAVNANLTPAQLIARIKSSAMPFPQPTGVPVCSNSSGSSGECACPNDGTQCGAGMVNALRAVTSALRPIAAVAVPAHTVAGSAVQLDASGSAAACGHAIAAYAWTASSGVLIQSGTNTAKVTVQPMRAGTLTLSVKDESGAVDIAVLDVAGNGAITLPATAPAAAGTSASACPTPMTVVPTAPTMTAAFSPDTVGENSVSQLTITINNANAFALMQPASFTAALPANLSVSTATAAATTCLGTGMSLKTTPSGATLSGAVIPASGACSITLPVQSAVPGSYVETLAAGTLTTDAAGPNTASATANLLVMAPSKSGGGALDVWDGLFIVGALLAGRRGVRRKSRYVSV